MNRIVNGRVVELTAEEEAAVLAEWAAAPTPEQREAELLAANKQQAKTIFDRRDHEGLILRSLITMMVREFNNLRQWDMALKAAVAAATNFADLKARIAALQNLPDRTKEQVRTALFGDIDTET